MKHGKKYADSVKAFDLTKPYETAEAVDIVLETAKAKFDETVECTSVWASIPVRRISRSAAFWCFPTERVRQSAFW